MRPEVGEGPSSFERRGEQEHRARHTVAPDIRENLRDLRGDRLDFGLSRAAKALVPVQHDPPRAHVILVIAPVVPQAQDLALAPARVRQQLEREGGDGSWRGVPEERETLSCGSL